MTFSGFGGASGNETLLHLAAVAGMGMAVLPKWLTADDLVHKRLEPVMPEWMTIERLLSAVYPSRKYLSAKVWTFIDFIAADPRLKLASASSGPAQTIAAAATRSSRRKPKRA